MVPFGFQFHLAFLLLLLGEILFLVLPSLCRSFFLYPPNANSDKFKILFGIKIIISVFSVSRFSLDSDVLWSYGTVFERDTNAIVAPALRPAWRQIPANPLALPVLRNRSLLALVTGKTEVAAWFASNCLEAPSNRLYLVKYLQKYMSVHVYGECGRYRCDRSENRHCLEMLEQKYMFYFAFENSLCEDYVTEKVFTISKYWVVPVVFGGVDYNRFMPPKSYINAEDFNSTRHLAAHLNHLAANPKEYIKYFWWKQFYHVTDIKSFCDLCQVLHKWGRAAKTQHYTDIDKWFNDGACRANMKIRLD